MAVTEFMRRKFRYSSYRRRRGSRRRRREVEDDNANPGVKIKLEVKVMKMITLMDKQLLTTITRKRLITRTKNLILKMKTILKTKT